MSNLHERIAKALGWSVKDTQSLTMHALRDLVRPVDPQLAQEMSHVIQSGAYIKGPPKRTPRSKAKQPRGLKLYSIQARIVSGITDTDVWEGHFEVPARDKKSARVLALDLIHESPYYDDRINPRVAFDEVKAVGEVEVLPSESATHVTNTLIAEARKAIGR